MTTLKFSPWAKWDNRVSHLERLQFPGIYALRISKRNLGGQPFDWVKDIVYFGMTNSLAGLKGRLSQFNNTLRDKSGGGHGGADRFRYDYENGEELANWLYVSVCPFECQARDITPENLLVLGQVAMAEYMAFAEYVRRFDTLPKYNNKKASPKLSKELTSKVRL
jgi:hypothetical protein